MNTANAITSRTAGMLRAAITGEAFPPGDPGYGQARRAWNLAVDERPAVVVEAETAVGPRATRRPPASAGRAAGESSRPGSSRPRSCPCRPPPDGHVGGTGFPAAGATLVACRGRADAGFMTTPALLLGYLLPG